VEKRKRKGRMSLKKVNGGKNGVNARQNARAGVQMMGEKRTTERRRNEGLRTGTVSGEVWSIIFRPK